jgi:putative transposase
MRRNVKRACELLKVSRAAFYQQLARPSRRRAAGGRAGRGDQDRPRRVEGRLQAPRVHARLARRSHHRGRKRERSRLLQLFRQ